MNPTLLQGTRIPTLRRPATVGRLILRPQRVAILPRSRPDTKATSKTATHLRRRRTTTTTTTILLSHRLLLPTITTKRTLDALLSYADVWLHFAAAAYWRSAASNLGCIFCCCSNQYPLLMLKM